MHRLTNFERLYVFVNHKFNSNFIIKGVLFYSPMVAVRIKMIRDSIFMRNYLRRYGNSGKSMSPLSLAYSSPLLVIILFNRVNRLKSHISHQDNGVDIK